MLKLSGALFGVLQGALITCALAQEPGPPQQLVPPAPASPGPSIEATPLPKVDSESFGILDTNQGGLGLALWQGGDRALVARLLPLLPAAAPLKSLRDLERRLLLSTATAPPGNPQTPTLLTLRAARLMAMGDIADADILVRNAAPDADRAQLAPVRADLLFLAGKVKEACAETAGLPPRVVIFCQIQGGETEKAQLGLDLLAESGEADPTFATLAAILMGSDKEKIDKLAIVTPLHLAMLRATGRPAPKEIAPGAQPAVLAAIAADATQPIEARLEAGERAEALGLLPTKTLRTLYGLLPLRPEALAKAAGEKDLERAPRGRIILYRAALEQTALPLQVQLLARCLEAARMQGKLGVMARAAQPMLEKVPVTPEFAGFATDAVRGLLAAGDLPLAVRWADLAKSANPDSYTAVWPLLRIARGDDSGAFDPAPLAAWRAMVASSDGAHAADRIELVQALLTALSDPIQPADWQESLSPPSATGRMPRAGLWFLLDGAVRQGKLGETVLVALDSLGEAPNGLAPAALATILAGLKSAGLTADARALGLELALDAVP